MQIPSRAWGFIRSGLNGRFGVRVADLGTGGTVDNPLLNDIDAGDDAAGVEFCPVFASQEASGTLTVRSDGSLSFVGAADGTYVIPYSLPTFTPGDAASVDEGNTDVTITIGVLSAESDRSLVWTVRSGVSADRALSWSLRNSTQADQALAWALRNSVQADVSLTWDILNEGQVVSDQPLAWVTRSAAQADRSLAWIQRSVVQADRTLAWLTYQGIVADQPLAWTIDALQSVTSDQPLAWAMRAAVTKDRSLAWTLSTTGIPPRVRLRVTFTQIPAFLTRVVR